MSVECYPITILPNLPALFRDYTELRTAPPDAPVRRFYPGSPFDPGWQRGTTPRLQADRADLVNALTAQSLTYGAGPATFANLELLRHKETRAVVTGQQVGLFGGPLLTLLKAATAIRKAQVATQAGTPTVPVFWMATEDHDLDEVNVAPFLRKHEVVKLRSTFPDHKQQPVGSQPLGPQIAALVEQVEELLAYAPVTELLRKSYTPQDTLASAFGKFLSAVFHDHGLIVLDASSRAFHQMGAPVLRQAIEQADELHAALHARNKELERAGYATQVLVHEDSTLLFLIDEYGQRLVLKRPKDSEGQRTWTAGSKTYTTADLLGILEEAPERLSPNALLRPVFQDSILPTSAYVGGPAEIAYLAQSQPLFHAILGTATPALPRLSATLVPPAIAAVMDQHELTLRDCMTTADDLSQRLAARAMPIQGKRTLATAGNALDEELKQVEHWMSTLDPNLGRSATVAASKMRYQMNRLRRLAANWQLQKETHLRKHADAITCTLFPEGHVQERLLSGAQLLAMSTEDLATLLVDNAEQECPGHRLFHI